MKIGKIVKLGVPLVLGAALLSSCIGVNERLKLNANGSGVLTLTYRISKMVADLAAPPGTTKPVPLPTTAADFKNAVTSVPGLTLESYSTSYTPQDVVVTAQIAFTNPDALSRILQDNAAPQISLTTAGGRTTFREVIFPGNPQGVDPDTLGLITSAFKGYDLTFTLDAPATIQSVSLGSIAAGGRTATYETSVVNAIQSKTPIVWEVSW